MRRCCILGGTGFIGSHLVEELLSTERELTVFAKSQNPTRTLPSSVRYFYGNCFDYNLIEEIVKNMDEVVLTQSCKFRNNLNYNKEHAANAIAQISGLLHLLSNIKRLKKVIYISSGGAIYGNVRQLPICETSFYQPISHYGLLKLHIEEIGRELYREKKLPLICARPANAYGERQKPFLGQGLIVTALASIITNKNITIYGKDNIRDYIYVKDLAKGLRCLLDKGVIGESYNIGTGIGWSNIEVIELIKEIVRPAPQKVNLIFSKSRRYDVKANILDCDKIFNDTGWAFTTNIKEGIKMFWKWLRLKYSYPVCETNDE